MKKTAVYIYWALYAWYIYIFGYAALWKIFNVEKMMTGMQAFGFDPLLTNLIGWGEGLGLAGLIAGIWKPKLRSLSVLWLFPFAIGAFTAHMAHREYHHFYSSIYATILSYALLALDKDFKIVISPVSKTEA